MKNYKELFLNYLNNIYNIEYDKEWESIEEYDARIKSLELIQKFLIQRFENELKQYNKDELRACDEFIAKKNLDLLRYYIEEMYMLDKENIRENFIVRKHMRYILNDLFNEFNNFKNV